MPPSDPSALVDALTQNSQVANGMGVFSGHALTAQDTRESLSSAISGVVWVPDKGLSVPAAQEGTAGDAEAYREWWEQSEVSRKTCAPFLNFPLLLLSLTHWLLTRSMQRSYCGVLNAVEEKERLFNNFPLLPMLLFAASSSRYCYHQFQ